MLASAALNGTVQIWDTNMKQKSIVPPVTHYDLAVAMAFSPDATLFASSGADAAFYSHGPDNIGKKWRAHDVIQLWVLPTGDELTSFQQSCKALAFSPNSKILATSDTDVTRLWDVKTGAVLFKLDATQFFTNVLVAFSPDGSILATGGNPRTINLWNVKTGSKLATLLATFVDSSGSAEAEGLAFSPDNSILAVKYLNYTRLWDLKTNLECNISLTDQIKDADVLKFSPDGKILLTANWSYEIGSQIQLWEINTERKMLVLQGHPYHIQTLVFSHDGKTLASGSDDGTILLWDWEKIVSKMKGENK